MQASVLVFVSSSFFFSFDARYETVRANWFFMFIFLLYATEGTALNISFSFIL